MKILMVNASPKRITSASGYFLGLLNMQMIGCDKKKINLIGGKVYNEIFSYFNDIDALVIAMPVYVDGIPSHVLRFMTEAEKYCKQFDCKFKLYVITNCGFYEAKQCRHLLSCMRSFCAAAGLEWGAGIGIGTGEMLSVLRLTPIFELIKLGLSFPFFLMSGDFAGSLAAYPWIGFCISMSVYTLISSGLFYSIWKLKRFVRQGKTAPDFFTNTTLIPRFVFTLFANGYWNIRSALHGTGLWNLFRKDTNT